MTAAPDVPPFDPAAPQAWRTGSLRSSGLPRSYVDSVEWARPTRGVRLWLPPGAQEPRDRVYTAAAVLVPGSALGGWAAAWLHGVRWVDGRARDGSELAVPVVASIGGSRPRRAGIEVHRSTLEDADICVRSGLVATSGLRTAFDSARHSASLGDAVAWVDALLRAHAADQSGFEAYVRRHARWVGVARAREAARLATPRAASPQESRLRVEWLGAGLPPPLVNTKVWTEEGDLVGEADLLDPETGFVAEYDGWQHRRRDRRELDHGRGRHFADVGLTVRTYVDRDLAGDLAALHASLRAGHAAARTVRRRFWTLDPACFWD
jgi:hypothetical protein